MLGALVAFMRASLPEFFSAKARWAKTFLLNLYRLNRPVRLASAGWALKDEVCTARMSAALSGYLPARAVCLRRAGT